MSMISMQEIQAFNRQALMCKAGQPGVLNVPWSHHYLHLKKLQTQVIVWDAIFPVAVQIQVSWQT